MQTIVEFYGNTLKDKDCLLWLGAKNKKGYGAVNWKGKTKIVHRLSYELSVGIIPRGLFVCHSCDRPSCINPKHLWIGTPKQNSEDMVKKGRGSVKGIKPKQFPFRPNAKLTEQDVRQIRKRIISGETMVCIAKDYKISDRTINDINIGSIWASIDTEKDKTLRQKATKLTKSRVARERMTKLSIKQIKEIKQRLEKGEFQREIGKDYGVSQFCIYEIKHERRWAHIK